MYLLLHLRVGNGCQKLDATTYAYNPSRWEAEAGESKIQGYPGQPSKTLFQL